MVRVKNEAVWGQIRYLLLGSAALFLANIYYGFDNALTLGTIPRWQTLVHVHAGTLGWVTLSMIALAVWTFTGDREVSASYVRRIKTLTWISLGAFAGYILGFGLAFSRGQPFFYLLPIFGITSSLAIWAAAIYAFSQFRRQPVVTTLHLLLATGLIVAALGSTMGVLLGLEYLVGFFIPGMDRIGVHAGAMDAYLLLAAGSILELFLRKDPHQRWTRAGLLLAIAWGTSALVIIPGLLLGIMPLIMMSVPLLLVGLIIFLARGGWRGFATSPFGPGPQRWMFFGAVWTTFWGLFFVWLIANFADDFSAIPSWTGAVFAHSAFVGMMTNLLLGVYSARAEAASDIMPWGETAAMWLINLGLLAFFGLKIAADARWGALVMGVGVLLGVATMVLRLRASAVSESSAHPGSTAPVGVD